MLLDTILDFGLIPITIFVFILFICDFEDWEKIKKEVSNIFATSFYLTAFALAGLNLFLLMISVIASASGDYTVSLLFDFSIMVFTCLSVVGLVISEYWKRKLSEVDEPVESSHVK